MTTAPYIGPGPCRSVARRFRRDESGIAAMEFAILAPLIIGIYLGLAEFANVLSVERKISHSASVAGDLAAQVETVDKAQAEDIYSAVLHVANLNSISDYSMRVQSFERLADGTVRSEGVLEYTSTGSGSIAAYDGSSLSEDMLPRGEGLVVTNVLYRYKPFGFKPVKPGESSRSFLPDSVSLEETFFFKPRRSSKVVFGTDGEDSQFSCSGSPDSVTCSTS